MGDEMVELVWGPLDGSQMSIRPDALAVAFCTRESVQLKASGDWVSVWARYRRPDKHGAKMQFDDCETRAPMIGAGHEV